MPYSNRNKYDIKTSITEWLAKEKDAFESADDLESIFVRRYTYPDKNELTGELGDPVLEYEVSMMAIVDRLHSLKLMGEAVFQDIDLYLLAWNKLEGLDSVLSVTPESTPSGSTFVIQQGDVVYLPLDNGLYNIRENPNAVYMGGKLYYWELWLERIGDEHI